MGNKTKISSGGVVLNDSKVLMVFQKKTQTWSLPKGRVEKGESLEVTAMREIREETGLSDLRLVKELGSYERGTRYDPNLRKNITFFLYTTDQTRLEPLDTGIVEARWVPVEEVAGMLSYEEDKKFFRRVIDQLPRQDPQ